MAMPDNQLDFVIALALEGQTVVTRKQRRSAWIRLRQRVRITPRLTVFDRRRRISFSWQGLVHLLLAEDIYQRAARNRHFGSTLPLHCDIMICYHPFYPRHVRPNYTTA